MSWADSNNRKYGQYSPSSGKRGIFTSIKEHIKKKKEEAEKKAKAEKEYAAKQASVDTEIANSSNGKKPVSTPVASKDSLRIKKKNYSSMYKGSGRNLV